MKDLTMMIKSVRDLGDNKKSQVQIDRIQAVKCSRRFFMSSEEVYKTFYRRLCEANYDRI